MIAASPRRYEIYFADLDPAMGGEKRKVRPVVIVSRSGLNRRLDTVVVCPITTMLHPGWPSRYRIRCAGRISEIAVDQIRSISKQRLRNRIDRLSSRDSHELRGIVTEMYGQPIRQESRME